MQYLLTEKEIYPFRPKPFFFLNTDKKEEYVYEKAEKSLSEMKDCGFSGFILFNKPPTGFDKEGYLSDTWFFAVENFAKAAKKLSLEMWINDGFDYPPGAVGGKVFDIDPTLRQKRICLENGELKVKEVDWGFPAFENDRAWQIYNRLVYAEYGKRIPQYFGDPIKGFFSDADNRRVVPAVMFDKNHPCNDYFPWSDDFAEGFKAKYGYDVMPFMKEVIARKDLPQAVDYWEYAGNLYQSWFKKNAEWLKAHGLKYTGHTTDTSPFLYSDGARSSCFTEGRFSDIQSIFDYPGTDQELLAIDGGKHVRLDSWYTPKAVWGNAIHTPKMKDYALVRCDLRAKQAASTAYMYGKEGVMCEMFAASNYAVSPSELKHIAAYQIMQGVTFAVTHAYHYRFFGITKYFAPPEFSARGLLGKSVNELNDRIARLCCMMAKGKSVFDVALISPTEAVWRGKFDKEAYYDAFEYLNRTPYGFFICDKDKILNGDYGVKVAVIAGFDVGQEYIAALESKGIKVVLGDASPLEKLLTVPVSYEGEGHPHFARKNIDGEEFAFIANIETETPISGKITAYGREKSVKLYPGDIRYISARYDDIESEPVVEKTIFTLPAEAYVKFGGPNVIPLEYFTAESGEAVNKEYEKDLRFTFGCGVDFKDLRLFVPEKCFGCGLKVKMDGRVLAFTQTRVYDEEYMSAQFEGGTGERVLVFEKTGGFDPSDRIFLTGDFDAEIITEPQEYKLAHAYYNFELYIPEKAKVLLSPRRKRLKTGVSWAKQGQPFYSGQAKYSFDVNFKESGEYSLTLDRVRDVAEVYIDGVLVGKKTTYPYIFPFSRKAGAAVMEIVVTNSLGNAFECYLEDSGIYGGGKIDKIKSGEKRENYGEI